MPEPETPFTAKESVAYAGAHVAFVLIFIFGHQKLFVRIKLQRQGGRRRGEGSLTGTASKML